MRWIGQPIAQALAFVALAGPALAAAPPEEKPARSPAAVVELLLAAPPRALSQLERVVGSFDRDPRVWAEAVGPLVRKLPSETVSQAWVELAIDIFHEDPQQNPDPLLASYELRFLEGAAASRGLLAAKGPAPVELAHAGRAVWRFDSFYFAPTDGDGFTLSWYDREPEFAIPRRGDEETARLVAAIAAIAEAGFTRSAIAERLGPLELDKGWNVDFVAGETWRAELAPPGGEKAERFTVRFKRPLPGAELVRRLGVEVPRVVARDVHMVSRGLVDLAHPHSEQTGYGLPAYRGWVLDVEIVDEGLTETDESFPGSPVWQSETLLMHSFVAFRPKR